MKSSFFYKPLVQLHTAVLLWGFTAILGKLISIPAIELVFLRMNIAALVFFILPKTRIGLIHISKKHLLKLIGIGLIICLHWLCFYQSIKEFNSSGLALVCLGTGPMFVVWLEYVGRIKKSFSRENFIISIVAIMGMILIVKGNGINMNLGIGAYERAIFYGISAAFLAALFTILNSKFSNKLEPPLISFIEMLSGGIGLFVYFIIFRNFDFIQHIPISDSIYILILSIFCTNIPFLLSIYALKKIEPFIVTLAVNLEPIYGLLLASILFKEFLVFNYYFYLGAFFILISVFIPIIFGKWKKRKT